MTKEKKKTLKEKSYGDIANDIKNRMGKVKQSIKNIPGTVGKDIRYAVWDSEGPIGRFKRGLASLFGFEWESLEGVSGLFTKTFIFFVLFCIFPAIPMFMVMGVLYKFSQLGFYYTRLL